MLYTQRKKLENAWKTLTEGVRTHARTRARASSVAMCAVCTCGVDDSDVAVAHRQEGASSQPPPKYAVRWPRLPSPCFPPFSLFHFLPSFLPPSLPPSLPLSLTLARSTPSLSFSCS